MELMDLSSPILSDGNSDFLDLDRTPVSKLELRTWFLFGASIDVAAFPLAVFSPVISQGMLAAVGFESDNHSIPCDSSVSGYSCVVKIGSTYIDTTSYFFYGSVVATLLQVFLFIGLGSLADHGPWRKRFMLIFSIVGATCCILFPTVFRNDMFIYCTFLSIMITVCLGAAFVFLYSYLPPLARNHPDFLLHLETPNTPREKLMDQLDSVTNDISSKGFVYMFSATISMLVLAGIIASLVQVPSGGDLPSNYGFQLALMLGGIFWFLGIWMAWKYLRERPGPPFPPTANIWTYSCVKVFHTFKKARKLGNLFVFLVGWFMYSDAFNTLSTVAILYAQSALGFSTTDILVLAAEVPILALMGTVLFSQLQKRTGWGSKRILLIQNAVYAFVPLYAGIGLIPGSPIGYKSKWELFVGAGVHGLLMGATQSSCRSLFSQLLPPGSESEFFSLYEITDKGSSWVGPLIVATINSYARSKLWSFLFLAAQFGVALAFFMRVNVESGVDEGRRFGDSEREREKVNIAL
ncbi:MFS general substrate transporter [Rhizoclosmatium globosum]|uniref:Autophagy-related protein n=1 Tax=Rhizoclosmatium globosum TaxID=329046 RepID=A0A1Y2CN39_9FUNG|nr:MFS general substrate transporter [Rhizoclosmatium globosum]|eukprot:ORY48449.1 MFS general substrate transporter [Rhizoclosmatium globosum]